MYIYIHILYIYIFILGLPPTQDASDHQDFETCLEWNPCIQKKDLLATVTGWSVDSLYINIYIYISIHT